ncbi:MAG: zinc ribbon domain-containing protein [Planctomycetaceae bacterium]|nr:zinc ribbon domain-containing protein [Planctomycetaceae bacterium]
MLLLWGSGGGHAVLGELPEEQCEACGAKSTATALVTYRYWHLWYLFSFLVRREYFKACSACGAVVPFDKTEARLQFPKDNIPFIRKRGWLAVIALIGFCILLGAVGSWRNRAAVAALLAEPKVMDFYYADLARVENSGYRQGGPSVYGVMALLEEREDGAFLVATSTRAFSKKSELEKVVEQGAFQCTNDEENPLICSREELAELLRASIIYGGKRPLAEPSARE